MLKIVSLVSFVILLLVLEQARRRYNQQGGAQKKIFGKMGEKRGRKVSPSSRLTKKDDDDPYAWIRPMVIVDFFRTFWITR